MKGLGWGSRRCPISASPVVRHVLLDDFRVAVAQHHGAARVADELGGPLDHAVALALRLNLHLAGGGHLEALFRAALRLQFGHFACSLSCRWRRSCTRIATETNAPKAPVREQGCDRRL